MPAAGGEYSSADRDLDAVRTIARHHRRIETSRDALGQLVDAFCRFGARRGDGEFVAAQPGDNAGADDLVSQACGNSAQQQVAIVVSKQAVDLLKAVEANDSKRDLGAC